MVGPPPCRSKPSGREKSEGHWTRRKLPWADDIEGAFVRAMATDECIQIVPSSCRIGETSAGEDSHSRP